MGSDFKKTLFSLLIRKEEVNLPQYADDFILYIENPEGLHQKTTQI